VRVDGERERKLSGSAFTDTSFLVMHEEESFIFEGGADKEAIISALVDSGYTRSAEPVPANFFDGMLNTKIPASSGTLRVRVCVGLLSFSVLTPPLYAGFEEIS